MFDGLLARVGCALAREGARTCDKGGIDRQFHFENIYTIARFGKFLDSARYVLRLLSCECQALLVADRRIVDYWLQEERHVEGHALGSNALNISLLDGVNT